MDLLLLPGMDGTGWLFEPFLRALPRAIRAHVVSYPSNIWRYAELLEVVRAAVPGDRDFAVLGESFSGPLALKLAALSPSRLRGVILSSSFARNPLGFAGAVRVLVNSWTIRVVPLAGAQAMLLGRQGTEETRRLLRASLAELPPSTVAGRVRELLSVNVHDELRACTVPLLSIRAGHDRIVGRRSSNEILKLNPGAREVTLPGPHLILQACPEAASAAVNEFLAAMTSQP